MSSQFPPIRNETDLTRFATSSKEVAKTIPRVKAKAFLPFFNPESSRFELSTYRIDGLSESAVWDLRIHINANVHARADLPAEIYLQQRLQVDFNNQPERHCDVIGWPMDKEDRLAIAAELSQIATYELETVYLPPD